MSSDEDEPLFLAELTPRPPLFDAAAVLDLEALKTRARSNTSAKASTASMLSSFAKRFDSLLHGASYATANQGERVEKPAVEKPEKSDRSSHSSRKAQFRACREVSSLLVTSSEQLHLQAAAGTADQRCIQCGIGERLPPRPPPTHQSRRLRTCSISTIQLQSEERVIPDLDLMIRVRRRRRTRRGL